MTFASGPALVKWPQHLQQEHGDCQRKFGLISSSSTPPPQPFPPFITAATLPPFQSLCLFPFPSHFALKFVNLSGFLLCSFLFCFSHTFFSWRNRDTHNSQVTRRENVSPHPPHLIADFPASLPVQHLNSRWGKGEEVIQIKMISLDFGSGQTATCVLAV